MSSKSLVVVVEYSGGSFETYEGLSIHRKNMTRKNVTIVTMLDFRKINIGTTRPI